jgi:DNA-binding MarR family transcriptional regulator
MRKDKTDPFIPEPGEGKRGETGHLGYLLRQANVALRTRIERALADLGVTQPQFLVLTMVAAYPGLSNADLARLSLLTPQTVSVIVANLKRAKLLESRPHAVHGRIKQLALTAQAAAVLKRCRQRVAAIEADLARGLSAVEERSLRRFLVRVALESDGEAGP